MATAMSTVISPTSSLRTTTPALQQPATAAYLMTQPPNPTTTFILRGAAILAGGVVAVLVLDSILKRFKCNPTKDAEGNEQKDTSLTCSIASIVGGIADVIRTIADNIWLFILTAVAGVAGFFGLKNLFKEERADIQKRIDKDEGEENGDGKNGGGDGEDDGGGDGGGGDGK